jgi:hypothetical protein
VERRRIFEDFDFRRWSESGVKWIPDADDHIFSLDLESWEASIATEKGRVKVKLLHGIYQRSLRG